MSATAEAPATSDIVALLEDREMSLLELASVVDAKVIAKAWAGGMIEFGRRKYCTTGPAGTDRSILIVEDGMEWTGPKSGGHKTYAGIATDELPECAKYERADVPMLKKVDARSGHETFFRPSISRHEAEALCGLQVRLTDKGLATLAV
jgi:hypothetical protein